VYYIITMARIGVIGGSGLTQMPGLAIREERSVETPYGEPSAAYRLGEANGTEVVFLPRHGHPHTIPPHNINYRANLWGFRELGVERILSVNASGGITLQAAPGAIMVLDQVLDQTQGARASTYFEGPEVVHIDFTEPFCPELRAAVLGAAWEDGIEAVDGGTYVCVHGPRLESLAEIRHFASMGADVVGMTAMPEAALARELELCYSAIAVSANWAAGISDAKLSAVEVVQTMQEAGEKINLLLSGALGRIPQARECGCKDALRDARV
jgi:5'-methylthioadenosine phosphorylase